MNTRAHALSLQLALGLFALPAASRAQASAAPTATASRVDIAGVELLEPVRVTEAPRRVEAFAGTRVPPRHLVLSPAASLYTVGGAVTLGIAWFVAAGVTFDNSFCWGSCDRVSSAGFVPAIGPYIAAMGWTPNAGVRAALLLAGGAQDAGLALLILGIAQRVKAAHALRDDSTRETTDPHWALLPTVRTDGAGVSAVATF